MTDAHAPYPVLDPNPDFAAMEKDILHYWKSEQVFQASVENRPVRNGGGKSNAYVFYDGPPFANGLPHYGHLLTGYVKDSIARYQTMKGLHVARRFGWDCHGLPAEMGAEKELNVAGRLAILDYGIGKFNDYCRSSVMRYVADWEYYVSRQGRWVDFANDYKTMDTDFMESVIWAFSELYKKDLVFEAFRVMPYSWAAESTLSNFEIRMDNATREREDKAAYVKFKLADGRFLVAWTTTPWTLPSNLALAVSPTLEYAAVNKDGETVIVAASAVEKLFGKEAAFTPLNGTDLIGLTYEPLFPYFAETKNAFRVVDGKEAVLEGEGVGVIHMAPGFGEIDQKICAENGIEVVVPVDSQGKFTAEIFDLPDLSLQGLLVVPDTRKTIGDIHVSEEDRAQHIEAKDVAKYGLANMRIVRWLKAHNMLLKDEPYKHNYPHCYRTDTPVIYRAMSSWYVAVTKFRDRAVELNQQINWVPEHVKNGQMGHMLATAPDWSISRNRFWGTPIPIWRAPSGKMIVPGSIAEIEQLSGKKVEDLHRPFIDSITFQRDGETYTRVEDVFDCWFESGSMPYAQLHYPFENKQRFEENFPADFITEYVGQTRGWFNTLIMLSTALFDKPPFKNVICHGVVLDEETGQKYSKRLKNYKDPKEVMDNFGADALRWMMLASPVMRGADIGVDPDGVFIRDAVRLYLKPIWNAYNFFTLYANADGITAKEITQAEHALDRYILAKTRACVEAIEKSLDAYDTPGACAAVASFLEVLNNWYIRRNRARFWKEERDADKQAAYDTLYTALVNLCRAAAPLLPFLTERVYLGLTQAGEKANASQSVHLADFPDLRAVDAAPALVHDMDRVRDACTAMLSIRNAENIRVRQPLAKATLYGEGASRLKPFIDLIADEANVKHIVLADTLGDVADYKLQIHFPIAGKRLGGKMKAVAGAAKAGDWKREGDTIVVGGEPMQPEEYVLQLQPKISKGAQALSANDAMVVLDLEITPELEQEGIARDAVRFIQQSRKEAGLNVSDRIALTVEGSAKVLVALKAHAAFIQEQTLAVALDAAAIPASAKRFTGELEGEALAIGITLANVANAA